MIPSLTSLFIASDRFDSQSEVCLIVHPRHRICLIRVAEKVSDTTGACINLSVFIIED